MSIRRYAAMILVTITVSTSIVFIILQHRYVEELEATIEANQLTISELYDTIDIDGTIINSLELGIVTLLQEIEDLKDE